MFVLEKISLEFPHKVCFKDFSVTVGNSDRIGIIGRNGSGKSSLLRIINEKLGNNFCFLIPQVISDYPNLSGGERFNKKLSEALSHRPDCLLLDEPTNHLDISNRKNLMRMLKKYNGTTIIVTHDPEILRNCVDTIWHIDNGVVKIFRGNYDDYIRENQLKFSKLHEQLDSIKYQKKKLHEKLQKEQERQAHSKASGEKKIKNKRWMKSVADLKTMAAEKASGKIFQNLNEKKSELLSELDDIFIPEELVHNVSLTIVDGAIGYTPNEYILRDININLDKNLAIIGPNGSGKTTLVKSILNDPAIYKTGEWFVPARSQTSYLDQHYSSLDENKNALEIMKDAAPSLSSAELRKYLNDFLFRKNEEVTMPTKYLSGGERARLCLAQISISPPALLIPDEITNNIDLETRNHVIDVMKNYSGKFIVISHDQDFLKAINVEDEFEINMQFLLYR